MEGLNHRHSILMRTSDRSPNQPVGMSVLQMTYLKDGCQRSSPQRADCTESEKSEVSDLARDFEQHCLTPRQSHHVILPFPFTVYVRFLVLGGRPISPAFAISGRHRRGVRHLWSCSAAARLGENRECGGD